ncbi:MAG: hypothetical protein Udaeo2_13450 [Candidatus Udaeobacter sp.]|nr:MAG: hypothetical protein Udaeo2_13450 [Candidatus Udaeobacter sp.]
MVSSPIAPSYKAYWQNQDALFVGTVRGDSPNAFAGSQPSLRSALLRQFHTIGIVSNERALYFRNGVFVIQCKVTEPAHREEDRRLAIFVR